MGIGDPTANVANTLGDFQFEYKPPATDFDEDYMGISDRYNFPTSDQGKHGFFPGNKFNVSGEITNPDQKREIRDAIFDLQSKQRISNLAKGDPETDWSQYSEPSVRQGFGDEAWQSDPWGNRAMEQEKIDPSGYTRFRDTDNFMEYINKNPELMQTM